MPVPKPRYSKEEFARRGDEIYDRDISPHVGPNDEGKFVVIDIETGAYEIDQDELAASDRLLAHRMHKFGRGLSAPGMPADLALTSVIFYAGFNINRPVLFLERYGYL